jgi:transcriptional regulator with XRE-family HTH domain
MFNDIFLAYFDMYNDIVGLTFDMHNDIIKKRGSLMSRRKKSEKLLLEKIASLTGFLLEQQRGLDIGQLIALIRGQLGISQRLLAKRAKIPQPTVSRIESGSLSPNVTTLQKILDAMGSNLLLSVVLRESPEVIRRKQAEAKARKKVEYLQGTMSLEKQETNQEFLKELMEEEVRNLLEAPNSKLWEEDL